MNFEEWYKETYDPNYGKEHKEWEQAAWNAAIDEAMKAVAKAENYFDNNNVCNEYDAIVNNLKELKE